MTEFSTLASSYLERGSLAAASPIADSFGRLAFAAAVLVLIVLGLYWVARRVGRLAPRTRNGSKAVSVVQTVPLGDRRFLALVDAAGEYLLLGVTSHHVEVLTRIDGSEVEAAPEPLAAVGGSLRKFLRLGQDVQRMSSREEASPVNLTSHVETGATNAE